MATPNKQQKKNVYIKNRPATFQYSIEDKLTAGIVLTGSEIKSIRLGKVSFADSFCFFHEGELWVKNLHIAEYVNAGYAGHDPVRERKLLLTKRELKKWQQKIKEKGFTIVPLAIYIDENGWAKMDIGLGRGKKLHDKRATIRDREASRNLKDMGY
ncbi:MAG TPA: SsrA-binding protein SmpB [Edaphocola sp.]|nr:SsrA-binding protein SmpB [Edaphocola sp.]